MLLKADRMAAKAQEARGTLGLTINSVFRGTPSHNAADLLRALYTLGYEITPRKD